MRLIDSLSENAVGQGLVELLVILPITIFLIMGFPLVLSLALQPVWIDELLYADLLNPEDRLPFEELSRAHEGSRLPVYFHRDHIAHKHHIEDNHSYRLPLQKIFPGTFRNTEIKAEISPLPDNLRAVQIIPEGRPQTIVRDLAFQESTDFSNGSVRDHLKIMTLGGTIPGSLARSLRKIGIDTVPLNLDALPVAEPNKRS